MKNYAAYLRCSREEQLKGFSHEYQISGVQNNPRVKDMKCVGIFKEAVTGTRFDNREQLDLVFNIYERTRGALDYVLVYRWDRLGRDVGSAFQTIKKFLAIGVEINCPDKWIDYNDPNWPVILGIEFGIAQSESHKISERTKDGMYQANAQGYYTANSPKGYKRVETDQLKPNGKRIRIMVPDENAEIVTKVLMDYADGLNTKIELFRSYGEKLGLKKTAFYDLFNNIAYAGFIRLKPYKRNPERIVKAKHEALISKEDWDRIQSRIERDTRPACSTGKNKAIDNFFYLKGLLKCCKSGKHMTAYEVRKKSGKSFFYYQTSRSKDGQLINAINAHQVVSKAVYEIKIPSELYQATRKIVIETIKSKTSQDKKREAEIKRTVGKIKVRVEKVQDSFADGIITAEDYKSLADRYKEELRGLEVELATLRVNQNEELNFRLRVLDMLGSMGDVFRLADFKRKKILLRAIFPEGFSVEGRNVLTPTINYYLHSMVSQSKDYETIKIKTEPILQSGPVMGGGPCIDLTKHKRLLDQFLIA